MRRALILATALALGGCGSGSGATGPRNASLILDFTPNAVHAGIYAAIAQRYDLAAGVRLAVVVPGASTDSIKLLEIGRVNFAILDIHDLAIADAQGQDLVGVMAIVERPLAAVIAQPQIRSPRQLTGRLVGVTGAPSDTGVLDSIVSGAGGNPALLKTITIGFDAVPDLLAGKVAAATAFWNDEGVTLRQRRPGMRIFRVEAYGAPPYPELVLCVTRREIKRDPALVRSVVTALVRGTGFALAHPDRAAADLEARVPGLDPKLVADQLAGLEPAFIAPQSGRVGALDPGVLATWARWEVSFGVVRHPPDIQGMFDPSFVTSAAPSRAIRERGTTTSKPA